MAVDVRLVPCLQDNYAVILRDPATDAVIVVDVPEAAPVLRALDLEGWHATHILITHKHEDHVAGVAEVKRRFGATVIAPAEAQPRLGGTIDRVVGDGDTVTIGDIEAKVIATPGHTDGHVSFWLPKEALLFAGDTMFVMGCGRVLEGVPPVLWESLKKLRVLPPETKVYVGHEYTQSNARFSLTIDPDNKALAARAKAVDALRAENKPTLPTTIAEELQTNPFLRADAPEIAASVGMSGKDAAAVFTEIRERKNRG